jgi:hypothetical protein
MWLRAFTGENHFPAVQIFPQHNSTTGSKERAAVSTVENYALRVLSINGKLLVKTV